MVEQLPIEAMGLGTPIGRFTVRRATRVILTLLSIGFASLAVLFVVALLFCVQVSPSQQGEALLFDAIFALPLAVLACLLLRRLYAIYGLRLALYSDGLVLWRHGEITVVRWHDVESVRVTTRRDGGLVLHLLLFHAGILLFLLTRLSPRQTCSIRLGDGRVIKIPTMLSQSAELGSLIEREVTRALLPRALATCDGGGTLAFGALTADREGLHRRNKTLPWRDVARMEVRGGRFRILRQGRHYPWASLPTGKVPNIALLQALFSCVDEQ